MNRRIDLPWLRLSPIVFALSAALLGGCSQSAAECATEQTCNQLGNQTVAQCTTNGDACLNTLRQGNASCVSLADAVVEYDSCASGLTCSDRQLTTIGNSKCSKQADALSAALGHAAAAGCPMCGTSADGGS